MNGTFICAVCQEEHPISEREFIGEDAVCETCAASDTVVCESCGERILIDDNAGDDHMILC